MIRPAVMLLGGALAALLAAHPLRAQPTDPARLEALADSVAHAQLAGGVPGLTVAVARHGQTVLARGYGRANVELGVAADSATVYGTASLTKQFTAALVMRLVQAGKLALDEPITTYLPDYPAQGHRVTVRHLLTHTSGIREPTIRSEAEASRFRLDLTYAEMLDWFARQSFEFEPGTRFAYNSMGYHLLGEIVGRVAGTPYAELVERELLQPLGLARTVHCDPRRVIPNRADGYATERGTLTRGRFVSMQILGAAGALCSTVGDLARWSHLLHGGQVVTPASLRQMTAPTVLTGGDTSAYGFGLYVGALGEHRRLHHGGATHDGFGSYLAHYPDDGLTVVVLTNSAQGRDPAAAMEEVLARAALGMGPGELPLSPEEMRRYVGTYVLQIGGRARELHVVQENGTLMARYDDGAPTRFRHRGEHTFAPDAAPNFRYVFTLENGHAEGVTLRQGGRTAIGRRRP